MDFDDTPDEAAFRAKARAWLEAERPEALLRDLAAAEASDDPAQRTAGVVRAAKAWQQRKFAGGWACLSWPKAFGGRAATPIERVIWDQEESPYAALSSIFQIGQGMCGPTLMAFAGEAQKQRFLSPMASGEEIWCQLFSEPAAGSDLAGLRTRAERAGDDWIVNGLKVWTTGAHFSDYGILIVRTDPSVAKHKGLTMFFLDMRSPGVEIRPIRQASGQSGFNEVYFTDVRISDAQRLGNVGDGWNVSLTTLMNERFSIGSGVATGAPEFFELACNTRLADGTLAIDDPEVRSRLASWTARANGLKYTGHRAGGAGPCAPAPAGRRADRYGRTHRGRRADDAGDRDGRSRFAWLGGRARTLGQERGGQAAPDALPCGRPSHRGRLRRDHAQYRRRARARPAAGNSRG